MKPTLEIADILRKYIDDYCKYYGKLTVHQWSVVNDIMNCRTPSMGGRVVQCDNCGKQEILYNSCRNRHCPKCQCQHREQWIIEREAELLPVGYFHTIFTVPHQLNELFLFNKKTLYELLFNCVWSTINHFSHEPEHLGAQSGMISIMHTWGQNLDYHVHLHCIIPGGGLSEKGKWKYAKADGKYLFPVHLLSEYYKKLMTTEIRKLFLAGNLIFKGDTINLFNSVAFDKTLSEVENKDWVVYVKPPFSSPMAILNYQARYTHRVAISNYRLVEIKNDRIYFWWYNYKTSQKSIMDLSAVEFIRRFLQHIIPKRFRKIRYYGIFSAVNKSTLLTKCMMLLDKRLYAKPRKYNTIELLEIVYNIKIDMCKRCSKGRMLTIYEFQATRGDPTQDLRKIGVLV